MADDMISTLKDILGDNAEEKIQSVLSTLGNNATTPEQNNVSVTPSITNENTGALESVTKLKSIIDDMSIANDSRSNLLLSLKPYMRGERKKSIDNAIKLLNISKFSGLFKL